MTREEKLSMFEEVRVELKEELGIIISVEEIANIFTSQFKIMAYGFIKGIATTIPFFGKFIPLEYNHINKYYIYPNRHEQKRLIEEGKLDEAIQSFKDSCDRVAKKKKDELRIPLLSADEVLAYNNHIDIPDELDIFKNMK